MRGDERHRDAALDRSDSFAVLIDTYHDHQNAFFFEANVLSAMSDAVVSREGGRVNLDWDGIWEVAARRTESGWSVEFRIPFETLRFVPGNAQIWGVQFRRRIPRLKEVSFWNPLTPEQSFFEVSRGGHLLEVGATRQERRLSIKPYAKGLYQNNRTEELRSWDVDHAAGLDVRYRFQTNVTLDLTFNTDFAETEVDRFQSNLTRFPLFFPEKREFFLEGRGFYDFGLSGRVQPFFSRRIGLVSRRPVPIAGGGKLTGKVGPYGIGVLGIKTEEEEEVGSPPERFGVVRLTRDIGFRSNIGMIATHRGELGEGGSRTIGLDSTIAPDPRFTGNVFWARSDEPDADGAGQSGEAGYGQLQWRDPFWRLFLSHLRVDENFDPGLGFVRQRDMRETQGFVDIRPQPSSGPVREYGFKGELTDQTDTAGEFLYQSNYWRVQADFRSGDFVLLSWDPQIERLPEDFAIRPGIVIPAGRYRYDEYNLLAISDTRRPLSGLLSLRWGNFFSGRKNEVTLDVTTAPAEGLKFGGSVQIDQVRLPEGEFVAQIWEGNTALSFTNKIFLQGLVQWDKEARTLAANLRFSWEYRPGSRIYLIANPLHQGNDDTILFLTKITWLWEPL